MAMGKQLAVFAVSTFTVYLLSLSRIVHGNVIELDDRFLDFQKKGSWLVEFYAPWCGHCQKLAPVWNDVGLKLMTKDPDIKVAKLDGTRYGGVMDHFGVNGFPSIKFIKDDKIYTHKGGRTSADIIEFAQRAKGPAVRKLLSTSNFRTAMRDHPVFFVLVTEEDDTEIEKMYSDAADAHILGSYYFRCKLKAVPSDYRPAEDSLPSLFVYKDKNKYDYQVPSSGPTTTSITEWISDERFPAFSMVAHNNINDIASSEKFIVLAVTHQGADHHKKHPHNKMKEVVKELALTQREQFHERFVFGQMEGNDLINDITLTSIEVPSIVVLDPITYQYYLSEAPLKMTSKSLSTFLTTIENGTAEAFGGNNFLRKIYRVIYDIVKSVVAMWTASPIVTTALLVVPCFLMTFICYSIWSQDPYDDQEPDRMEGEYELVTDSNERRKVEELPTDETNSTHQKSE